MKKRVALVVILVVICLVAALWGLDFQAFWVHLSAFDLRLTPFIIVGFFGNFLFRCIRFRVMLENAISLRQSMSIVAIGFLSINIFPFRLGEFVRPYLLHSKHQVAWTEGMAVIIMERLIDMMVLLTLIMACGFFVDVPAGTMTVGDVDLFDAGLKLFGTSAIIGFIGVLVLSFAGASGVALLEHIVGKITPKYAPKISGLASRFVHGFRSLASDPRKAAATLASSVLMWSCTLTTTAIVMSGFEGLVVSFDSVLLNWTATVIAVALIPAPGSIGAFEIGSVSALVALGFEKNVSQSFSILNHVVMTGSTMGYGVFFLLYEGLSVTQLVKFSQDEAQPKG